MALEGFRSPLPANYFADGRRLQVRSKGPVQDRRDSLVDLLNDLRAAIGGGSYFVDPDTTDDLPEFPSIEEAFAAADAELPADYPVVMVLAAGKNHVITNQALGITRHVYFIPSAFSASEFGTAGGDYPVTRITGNFVLAAADSAYERLGIIFHGVDLSGNIAAGSNRRIFFSDSVLSTTITRTNGSNGVKVQVFDCYSGVSTIKVIDVDDPNNKGNMVFRNCRLATWLSGAAAIPFQLLGKCKITFTNVYWSFTTVAAGCAVFKLPGGGTASEIHLENTTFHLNSTAADGQFALTTGFGTTDVLYHDNATIVVEDGSFDIDLVGSVGTHRGSWRLEPHTDGPAIFLDPAPGARLFDRELNDNLVWDGTYWGNGSIFRKDLLVDVGSAGVSHTSGWTVPSGAGVLNTSANALKELTGASGAILYGISDGSDGDKFAESSALIQNSKASAKQASINVGGGDTVYVHSMTASGTEGGTLAGSNDKDVRVVVYFTMPKVLPSV